MSDAAGAVESYRAALAQLGDSEAERAAVRLRLGLALARLGNPASKSELQAASTSAGAASVWVPLLEANALAMRGDTTAVRLATTPTEILGDGFRGLPANYKR